ncbi:TetR/AcrR family transcriptional regulator [Streptomyces sp. 549]|uniref:TetR/AcrR family transcriptional regulator n=1 Tax=Streptomyces sp. 549 TaxID=3049076 RepID=UPI0024C3DCAF|nr:TetR/AcrR family transcriptional regulator [Streptomyces sp. 549]MDK1474570.1 TetR/AcrR family transcriptional regulator [Streptomyces sp. 549]
MTREEAVPAHPRRGTSPKREAIACAARAVFAREGYSRASVDAIAAEAGVSKRTIYNHYKDKEQLFLLTIQESAQAVGAARRALIERHLSEVTDLEADLEAFGRAWATPLTGFENHFALVRVIIAEAARLPPEILQGWHDAGPGPVMEELTRCVGRLAERGLLVLDDAEQATNHLMLLVNTDIIERSFHGAVPLADAEINKLVTAGVRTFLRLYGPGSTLPS